MERVAAGALCKDGLGHYKEHYTFRYGTRISLTVLSAEGFVPNRIACQIRSSATIGPGP